MTQQLQDQALVGATRIIKEGLIPRTVRVRPPAFTVRFSNGQWSIVDEFVVGPSGPVPSERTVNLSSSELVIFGVERTVDGILSRLPSPIEPGLRPGFLEQANPRAILEQVLIDVDVALDPGTDSGILVQLGHEIKASLRRLRDFLPVQ